MSNNKQLTIESGNLIRQYRHQKGKTIARLAEDVHLGDKHMGDIERGKHSIKLDHYFLVRKALDIPDDFWEGLNEWFDEVE